MKKAEVSLRLVSAFFIRVCLIKMLPKSGLTPVFGVQRKLGKAREWQLFLDFFQQQT